MRWGKQKCYRWGQLPRWRQDRKGCHHWCTPYSSQRGPSAGIGNHVQDCRGRAAWGGRGGHLCHCQPNSWPRWLWRLGHLCWVRRSQPGGSSNLPWEVKCPTRNSSRLARSRRPRSTGLAQFLFGRSGSSKRAHSSLFGNSPLTVSLRDSPRSGQIWLALPGECYYMPAGSCRGI